MESADEVNEKSKTNRNGLSCFFVPFFHYLFAKKSCSFTERTYFAACNRFIKKLLTARNVQF